MKTAFLALALILTTFAQDPQQPGSISGRVSDHTGAMATNATIQLRSVDTKQTWETRPYVGGLYRFRDVKPGLYELHITVPGFNPTTLLDIVVKPGEVTRADATVSRDLAKEELTVTPSQEPAGAKSVTRSLLESLPVVESATLRPQTLEEAPANVTVISAADIRRYGYRTLGEALSSARGFYFTNDRIYSYGGVRGLNIPGDYNTRFLVMINGHNMTESIYNSNGFYGQDFGLDMDLVERIEIVRGPSSALYGSNGILANINVVTKHAIDQARLKVSTENASFLQKKLHFSTAHTIGKEASLLFSGSAFYGGDRNLLFNEYDGRSTVAQRERGYHSFLDFHWKDWRVTGFFNNREVSPPIGWGDAIFDTRGNRVADGRNFAELAYNHTFKSGNIIRWRTSYDNYRYYDQFYFADQDDRALNQITRNLGDWINTQFSYSFNVRKIGELTIGTQARYELRSLQTFAEKGLAPTISISQPDRTLGVFAQQEVVFNKRLKAYIGVRFDQSKNYPNYLSPQAALVYEHSPRTIYKAVYGRPFRNPSVFEQYYGDGGFQYLASGGLRQETAQVFEGSVERKVTTKWSAIVNFYRYELNNLIRAVAVGTAQQYQNTANGIRSQGLELEISGRPTPWTQVLGSYGVGNAFDVFDRSTITNAPRHIGKARVALPLFRNRLTFSSGFQYLGPRIDRDSVPVRQVALLDFTANTTKIHRNLDVVMGIRNAMGYRYADPVSLVLPQIRQDGRTFFIKLIYHSDAN